MRLDLQRRLGLTKKPISPIPAPLLFYSVAMLGCMSLDQLSSVFLQDMISTITGVDFDLLPIVTSQGIRRMSYDDLCSKAKKWVRNLCRVTTKVRNKNITPGIIGNCHKAYVKECHTKGNTTADLDPKGTVAKRMLKDGMYSSWLILGIHKPELKPLLNHLTFMIKDDDDEGIKKYMKMPV
ncbi:hypothetical protein GGI17_001497 [Coemansia sp. S146]|nr:hypothetical protein GGI17_001497 [Coemansia sp. S146]